MISYDGPSNRGKRAQKYWPDTVVEAKQGVSEAIRKDEFQHPRVFPSPITELSQGVSPVL